MPEIIGSFTGTAPVGALIAAEIAVILLGALECFAGFKTIKVMRYVWTFLLGVTIGTAIGTAMGSVSVGVFVSVLLGIAIALVSYRLYPAGVFILIATLTYFAAFLICRAYVISVFPAVTAGALAVIFKKPVIIAATSFSGSVLLAVSSWMLIDMNSGTFYIPIALIYVLIVFAAVMGMLCQYVTVVRPIKMGRSRSYHSRNEISFSERRYPGMQRAYRNFCIKCGTELIGPDLKCPRCGFEITD